MIFLESLELTGFLWGCFLMKKYKAGVIGATGMVGQRFVSLIENHPWFELSVVAASSRSAGKEYAQAVSGRWLMPGPIPDAAKNLTVMSAEDDIDAIAGAVDFVFSAVDMKKEEIKALEETYAKAECPVVSNNSAHRWTPDVPMVIPEINPEHIQVVEHQRSRLGTDRGFIAVKSNCSIQSYVPALHPLKDRFGLERVLVCTYQAISGAGKNFETWPEMVDNVIPYIGGEEEKSELEPLKVWGTITGGLIVPASSPLITTQCIRVPATDGIWPLYSCLSRTSLKLKKSNDCGASSPDHLRSSNFLPLLHSSFTTLKKTIGRKPALTVCLKMAWRFLWDGCGPTHNMTISSSG